MWRRRRRRSVIFICAFWKPNDDVLMINTPKIHNIWIFFFPVYISSLLISCSLLKPSSGRRGGVASDYMLKPSYQDPMRDQMTASSSNSSALKAPGTHSCGDGCFVWWQVFVSIWLVKHLCVTQRFQRCAVLDREETFCCFWGYIERLRLTARSFCYSDTFLTVSPY